MMLSCNRFALVPHLCSECKNYIWLERYRRAEVWHRFADRYIVENVCKSCLTKFDVGKDKKMEHKKLIEDLLNDCNGLDALCGYISLIPEMEQLHKHLMGIKDHVLEAVDILKGEE